MVNFNANLQVFRKSEFLGLNNLLDALDRADTLEREKKAAECKLVDQKDYVDIKRECEILKETQFSGTDKAKLESQTLEGPF